MEADEIWKMTVTFDQYNLNFAEHLKIDKEKNPKKGVRGKARNRWYVVLDEKHRSSFGTGPRTNFEEEKEDHKKMFYADRFVFFYLGCVFLNLGCFLGFFKYWFCFYVIFILINFIVY